MQPSTIRGIVAYRKGRWHAEIALSLGMICAGGCIAFGLTASGPGDVAYPAGIACFIAYLVWALAVVLLLKRAEKALWRESGFPSIAALLEAEGGAE